MFDYFIRRLLLTVPTFIGCTIVVFFIVTLAPGGPLEQQIQALKKGSAETGGGGNLAGDQNLPPQALEDLKEFYGFDKPIWKQYLIWLGVWQRDAKSFKVELNKRRLVGDGKSLMLTSDFKIVDADNPKIAADNWQWENASPDNQGNKRYRIFRTEFSGILTGNFGMSYKYPGKTVTQLVIDRMPISLQFGIVGLILSYTLCVYLGIQKALRHNSFFDFASSSIVFIAYSIPGWALGAVLLVLLCTQTFFPLLPLGGFESIDYANLSFLEKIWDRSVHFVLPLIAYILGGFATLTMLMKNSLLDNLSQDYIRTAFAKGIREQRVIWLHAMRNSIIPVVTNIGYLIGIFVAGSYMIERVFNIDGIGKLTFEAAISRDYPIVFAFTVISVIINLLGSIISDLVLSLTDPRIRFK